MKLLIILLGMATAGLLGYVMEPGLRYPLTGISPKGLGPKTLQQQVPDPTAPASEIDPTTLTAEQLPEKVTLNTDIKFSDESSGLTMTVAAGSRVKLVRVDGTDVVVRPGETPYSIVLPITKTDLMEQLAAKPPAATNPPTPEPAPVPDTTPAPEPAPQPAPAVEPAPAPEPAPTAEPAPATEPAPAPAGDSAEPAPMPAPVVEPAPAPETQPAAEPAPQPAPATETTTTPAATGPVNVVKVMQDSIRAGQVKEFTFDQVLEWKAGPNETVEGEAFQTGTVSYKAETIFGVKTIQAKALIKDGKTQRWIWPKSGMEIK